MANVIVADNDVIIRGIVRSILEGIHQTVFLAGCGEEAIDLAASVQARLVLLDLQMPRLNGLLACQKLRLLPGYESTPIVILSGHDGAPERLAAARAGATQFIAKPFQPAHLLQSIAVYLAVDISTRELIAESARKAREISALGTAPQDARRKAGQAAHGSGPQSLLDEGKAVLDVYRSSRLHAAEQAAPRRRWDQ